MDQFSKNTQIGALSLPEPIPMTQSSSLIEVTFWLIWFDIKRSGEGAFCRTGIPMAMIRRSQDRLTSYIAGNLYTWTHGLHHDDVIKWKHFRVTGNLCGEFPGPRWIPHTKASHVELWCFLWSASGSRVEWTIGRLVNWDSITPIMTSL